MEFSSSADVLAVARIGDLVLEIVTASSAFTCLVSAVAVRRTLATMTRSGISIALTRQIAAPAERQATTVKVRSRKGADPIPVSRHLPDLRMMAGTRRRCKQASRLSASLSIAIMRLWGTGGNRRT